MLILKSKCVVLIYSLSGRKQAIRCKIHDIERGHGSMLVATTFHPCSPRLFPIPVPTPTKQHPMLNRAVYTSPVIPPQQGAPTKTKRKSSHCLKINKSSVSLLSGLSGLLVDEDVSEPGLSRFHVDDGLVGIAHGSRLDPGDNVLLGRELEELVDLRGAADEGTHEASAGGDEGPDVDGHGLFWEADLDDGAVEAKEAHVFAEGHLSWAG